MHTWLPAGALMIKRTAPGSWLIFDAKPSGSRSPLLSISAGPEALAFLCSNNLPFHSIAGALMDRSGWRLRVEGFPPCPQLGHLPSRPIPENLCLAGWHVFRDARSSPQPHTLLQAAGKPIRRPPSQLCSGPQTASPCCGADTSLVLGCPLPEPRRQLLEPTVPISGSDRTLLLSPLRIPSQDSKFILVLP